MAGGHGMEPAERESQERPVAGGTGGGEFDQHFFDGGDIVARDIPEGWIQAAAFDTRKPGASKKGESPSGVYRLILRACEQGTIRAYKDASRWVVNKADAEAMRMEFESTQQKGPLSVEAGRDLDSHFIEIRRELQTLNALLLRAVSSLVVGINEVSHAVRELKQTACAEPKTDIGTH